MVATAQGLYFRDACKCEVFNLKKFVLIERVFGQLALKQVGLDKTNIVGSKSSPAIQCCQCVYA